jgi:hypothetical protein
MKGIIQKSLAAFFFAGSICGLAAFGQEDLTAQQLVLLMKASSQEYKSISADIKTIVYQQADANKPKNVKYEQRITSRWTKDKEFIKIVRNSKVLRLDPNTGQSFPSGTADSYTYYSIAPGLNKRLVEVPSIRSRRAMVSSSPDLAQEVPCDTLYTAMWGLGGISLEKLRLDTAQVTFDKNSGLYILLAKAGDNPQGPKIRLYIDPSKNYIPVIQESMLYDGTAFSKHKCSDLRQSSDGLWIPYQYSWSDPRMGYFGEYKFEDVVVNKPIADNLLDIDFPQGTKVTDKRIGSTYVVGKNPRSAKAGSSAAVQQGTSEPNTATLIVQVTDDELRAAATKASSLLTANSPTAKPAPAVEVFPQVVFVRAGKSEYTLSVKCVDGKKAQLNNYSFKSDKMNLVSLQNQLAEQGTIVVNINRQPGHIGFETASLELQFVQGKFEVTFVSPPYTDIP